MAQLEAVHPCFKGCPAQTQPNRRSGNAHHTVHDVAGGPVRFVPVSRGMFLFSLAAAVLVAVLAHPAASISRLLSWKPLLWIGVRSYGIYLWHYPVMILTSPASGTGNLSLPQVALQIAASVLLAALSWKYVEEPIRHGGLKKVWFKARSIRRRPASISLRGWVVSLSSLILIGIFAQG